MNTESTLRNLIHREMRAHFVWHSIEKFEKAAHGYTFTIAVKSSRREYASAGDLVSTLKKHFRDVHLVHTSNYSTMGNENIFAMTISCQQPNIVSLPSRTQNHSKRAA